MDLFASQAREMFEERAAIREYDGLLTRDEAERLGLLDSEAWREACEVRHICDMPRRDERVEYLAAVEKKRGLRAANELRVLVEKEWWFRKNQKGRK